MTHAAARSNCPPIPAGFCTAPVFSAPAAGVGRVALGTGGLPGMGGAAGLAAPPAAAGLAGIDGLGFGAGGAALLPMTELGRDEAGEEPFEALTGLTAAAAARAAASADGGAEVPFAAGAGGGRRAAGGGGGGADSTSLRLVDELVFPPTTDLRNV